MASKDNFKAPTPPPGYVLTDEYPEVGWKAWSGDRWTYPIHANDLEYWSHKRYIAKPIPVPEGYRLATEEEAKAKAQKLALRYCLDPENAHKPWRLVAVGHCENCTDTYAVPLEPVKPLRVEFETYIGLTNWPHDLIDRLHGKHVRVTVEEVVE